VRSINANWRSFAILVLLLGTGTLLAGARLPIRSYTTDDGLPSNAVYRIVRDSRGFLWFCTREGIARFDGYQFTSFGREQGLPELVQDLLETRDGEYWLATREGVVHFNKAGSRPEFVVYRPDDAEEPGVDSLAEDGAGGIWCGTRSGLYHLQKKADRWSLQPVEIGMPRGYFGDRIIEALFQDRQGTLWVGGHNALYRCSKGGACTRYALAGGYGPSRNHILSFLEDHAGQLWIGTWEGLVRMSVASETSERQVERVYTTKDGLPSDIVSSLLETSDGHVWIGTSRGISQYISGAREEFENFSSANGLSASDIHSLAEDRDGNVWVGSMGAQKVSRGGFVTFDERDGLASRRIFSIFEDRAGELCVITIDGEMQINRFDGQRFHAVRPNVPALAGNWGWGENQLTFQDHTGEWWVPTGDGVFRFPISTWPQLRHIYPDAVYNSKNGVPGSVLTLFEDSRGDVWISTWVNPIGNRLMRWERKTGAIHNYSSPEGLLGGGAYAFAEDHSGNVWIGLARSLARFRQGSFQLFEPPKSFGDISHLRALHVDREGRLWAASRNGLVRIDSPQGEIPQFAVYTTADGLASNDVLCVTEDNWGRICAGTGHGVDCFYPRRPLRIKHYKQADGLSLAHDMVVYRDRRGALWFCTESGLARMEPEAERPRASPPIFISSVQVRGVRQPISALGETELTGLTLGPSQNQIEIDFVGLGLATGETLRYQYRLGGADADWSNPTDQRRVDYASLPAGSYRFQVRAISSDGLMSAKPAIVAFRIFAPMWQRWWMELIYAAGVAGIAYSFYRFRVGQLLAIERLRTRITTDLHDDIGSTLSQIAILSEVAAHRTPEHGQSAPLAEIANLSRESVDAMSDIVWAIDPGRDRLGDLSHRMRWFANDLFSSAPIVLAFRAPDQVQDVELGAEIRRQIFLIYKECLHNIARHSCCHNVEIDFTVKSGWLELTVRDDGNGFDAANAGSGLGLRSMERRAKELRGHLAVDSACNRGTTVRLQIPFRRSPKNSYTHDRNGSS